MLSSDFLSDLSLLSYKSMAWIWSMDGDCTMWLSELGTFAMFWDLKIHSITETDILWYDLREYVCWFWCNARMFLSISPLASMTPIINYPLCMIHDLATAHRHDHAWTENWAQNICTLRKLLSLMRPWYSHRQGARRRHLYRTKGAWKNYLTCPALQNGGVMIILKRAGW